ncbi:MAG: hypothetical protein JXR70_03465 [Spirochaetales bacterium]|nr:hypothetical protein [Spirochaetales bacterium]
MNDRFRLKLGGLKKELISFSMELQNLFYSKILYDSFAEKICRQMNALGYDYVEKDPSGNILGIIKGYKQEKKVVVIASIDLQENLSDNQYVYCFDSQDRNYFPGIIASLFTGGLLKRSITPLLGDVFVCVVPRHNDHDFTIRSLFDTYFRESLPEAVILAEPTGYKVFHGNRGRMEYEIVVKGDFPETTKEHGPVETLYPVLSTLSDYSAQLPEDSDLGKAQLAIKNCYRSSWPAEAKTSEYHLSIERSFLPTENKELIFNKAKELARNAYGRNNLVYVTTEHGKRNITALNKDSVSSVNEYRAWKMSDQNPLVLDACSVLKENGFEKTTGCWKKRITQGSYTYGVLGIPTIGFGLGYEDSFTGDFTIEEIEKSIFGKALIINRAIGYPSFGWSDDDF